MSEESLSIDDIYLAPVNFFSMELECLLVNDQELKKQHLLSSTAELCDEDALADVYLGWEPNGLRAKVVIHAQKESGRKESDIPSIEFFIDTRDLKSAGFNTRFCHHFLFTSEGGREVTRFRTEDAHPLCDPSELVVSHEAKSKNQIFHIFIPSQCLYGYDPELLNRLGFTYRIVGSKETSQHFSVLSSEYQIDQNPALWSTLLLVR